MLVAFPALFGHVIHISVTGRLPPLGLDLPNSSGVSVADERRPHADPSSNFKALANMRRGSNPPQSCWWNASRTHWELVMASVMLIHLFLYFERAAGWHYFLEAKSSLSWVKGNRGVRWPVTQSNGERLHYHEWPGLSPDRMNDVRTPVGLLLSICHCRLLALASDMSKKYLW
jgi:hypothetical protein